MAQPVETASDYRHTHKDLGLISRRAPTNGQTDRRYKKYYLPCFAVDNYVVMTDTKSVGTAERAINFCKQDWFI